MKLSIKKSPSIVAFTVLLSLGFIALLANQADHSQAADMSRFDPGNIMSDSVMANKNSMSKQQIQEFLLHKNPCNNHNTHLIHRHPKLKFSIRDGKFVCMAKEVFNGESAAQIIWQAAQDYSINPQVLLVLLEKEQSLVTDTWPSHIQYQSATGFGCPDTAACDSQYYGLKNQIRNAASLFRQVLDGGWTNYPLGRNYIYYNPNKACGGSEVNIQNRATSALYRYTPYQPNQAALNAGYGTGDGCSAYGNRNFYALFTDWFGTTSGISWEAMSEPRWMQLNKDSQKVNLSQMQAAGEILHKDRQLKLVSKTMINGTLYVRTEWDHKRSNPQAIKFSDLTEIGYVAIKPAWKMINYEGVHKYIARQERWVGIDDRSAKFKKATIVKVVESITINGRISYRTEFDKNNGIDLSFTENRLSPVNTLLPIYRNPQAINDILPVRVDGSRCSPIKKHSIVPLRGKAILGGKEVLSTTLGSDNINNYCFIKPGDVYAVDAITFLQFEKPRNMKLTRDVARTNLYTNAVVDTLNKGRVIHFSTKIVVHGKVYYRTSFNSLHNEPYIIDATAVTDL